VRKIPLGLLRRRGPRRVAPDRLDGARRRPDPPQAQRRPADTRGGAAPPRGRPAPAV